jgi:hypothetical protein
MTMLKRRLIIPAQPVMVVERLAVVVPRNLPGITRPPLLSFSGDGFVDAFLALASSMHPENSLHLPPLFAWRDWSEPPEELLTPLGLPIYPSSTIKREKPLGLRDATSSGEGDQRDPDDGVPSADPPWLRKLYLPQHERFTVVCVDVICQRHGQPWLDRQRVKEAGMVVRRLIPDPEASRERWEDWFLGANGEGSWQERFDHVLHPLGMQGDPSIGLDPQEAGLHSHPLRLIPGEPDQATITPCRLFGYLPVFSAERQQSPDHVPSISAWQQRTQERLEALRPLLADLAPARDDLQQLLIDTLLPDEPPNPASFYIRGIRQSLQAAGAVGDIKQSIDAAATHLVGKAIRRLGAAALDGARFDLDVRQDCADGEKLWISPIGNSARDVSENGFNDLTGVPSDHLPLLTNSGDLQNADWDSLVRLRVHQAVQTHLVSPSQSGLAGDAWNLLLVAALVRARGHLLALAALIQKRQLAISTDAPQTPEQLDKWNAFLESNQAAALEPAPALFSLAALLEWVSLFRRGDGAVWVEGEQVLSTNSQDLRILEILKRLLALHQHFDPLTRTLGEAGSTVRFALNELAITKQTEVLGLAGIDPDITTLARLGVPLNESPAEGVLLFPGSHPSDVVLDGLKQRSRANDEPNGLNSAAEIRALEQSTQLRYDSRHLYATWCWVRVSGRTPCERDQVIWSQRSEPFSIADPLDLLGSRPVALSMPDLPKLVKGLGRMVRAQAKPFASVRTPPQSGFSVGADLSGISRRFGLGGSCSFGIPVFTICALVLFSIVFSILSVILQWLPMLQICTPSSED